MRDVLAGASALPGANREEPQMRNLLLDMAPTEEPQPQMRNLLLGIHPWLGRSSDPSRGASHLRAIRNTCIMHLVDR